MIVVFDKDDPVRELRHPRELVDRLDELFARLIFRMGLSREDELDRTLAIIDQLFQAVRIAEEQRGALVGGESSRETDRQDLGIQESRDLPETFRTFPHTHSLGPHPLPDKVNQARLQLLM